MSEELYKLPDEWRWAELAEVVEIGSDQVLPKRQPNETFNYVALENVESATGRLIDFAPTPGANIASNKYTFNPQHVLYGKLRPYLQKALVPNFEGVSATDLLPLRPNPEVLDRRFLWRWLLSYDVLEYVTARQTGVKMPRLRTGDLESMPVPLPPLPEQHRIVEKIERLLSESRTAREALDRVPALLKRFRQAVLAKAFRGELTEPHPLSPSPDEEHVRRGGTDEEPASVLLKRIREERRRKWEEAHSSSAVALRTRGGSSTAARTGKRMAKYVEPEPPDTSDLPELPEGWCWASLAQLAWDANYGTSQKCSYEKSPFPVLRIPNIVSGQFDLADLKYAAAELDKSGELSIGDLLIIRSNGSKALIGRSALMRKEFEDSCFFASYIIRYRLVTLPGLAEWVSSIWDSPPVREWIEKTVSTSAGQYNISIGDLNNLILPLPPLAEQRRIVAKIESLFAQAEAIERAVEVARRRAEKVDQAILARAFRGGL